MNLSVNLTKRVTTPDGQRFYTAMVSPNGRIKPDWVCMDGKEVRCPKGTYNIDYTDPSGKRVRTSVGAVAAEAQATRLRNESLREFRSKDAKGDGLVFCTASGRPYTHMLRALKRNAARAGLDPERYWLHKFRATFTTMHLAAGVDLRTVQAWLYWPTSSKSRVAS